MNMEPDDTIPELRLEIGEHKLPEEWRSHGEQAFAWSKYAATCRLTLDQAKGQLKAAEIDYKQHVAEANKDIRANPDGYGIGKVTDKAVENAVPLHPLVKDQSELETARTAVGDAQYKLDVAEGACSALKDRKHALQDLVELLLGGFAASPKQKTSGTGAMPEASRKDVRRGRRKNADVE